MTAVTFVLYLNIYIYFMLYKLSTVHFVMLGQCYKVRELDFEDPM